MLTIILALILFILVLKFFPSLIIVPTLAVAFTLAGYWFDVEIGTIIVGLISIITIPAFVYYLRCGGATKLFLKHPELSALCNPNHESSEVLVSPANSFGSMVFMITIALGGAFTVLGFGFLLSLCSAK